MQNSKYEIRNTKQIRNDEIPNFKRQSQRNVAVRGRTVWKFLFLGFVICFGFRVSDFGFSTAAAQSAEPTTTTTSAPANTLQQRLAELSEEIVSGDAAVRTQAMETLTRLQNALVELLMAYQADADPEVRARAGQLLAGVERTIHVARVMVALGPEMWAKFDALKPEHGDLCRAMLGASEAAKLSALRELARLGPDDKDKTLEPLIAVALHSRYPRVQVAAMEVAVSARYTSEPVVGRLVDFATSPMPQGSYFQDPNTLVVVPWQSALHALDTLGAANAPHAAARLAAAATACSNWPTPPEPAETSP